MSLSIGETEIPGLLVIDLPLHSDARGWFKENWQRHKMVDRGLPDFAPVQQNMSHNLDVGVTRGFHAEPWDKLVSVACGAVFGAWVDLRQGATFGRLVTTEIGPGRAVFVPRGIGNAFQSVQPGTTYSYLVNEHWSEQAKDRYTFVNLADETIDCPWPIPLSQAVCSEADLDHPRLEEVRPLAPPRTLVIGADGQLGQALRIVRPDAEFLSRAALDISDAASVAGFDFDNVETIINAAAWTAVDLAETPAGRAGCWATNSTGVARLVDIARRHRATFVQVSSDYVFDGTSLLHTEDEPFAPLSAYGASKAAGDAIVATWERHYVVRTSWVIGTGNNFVRSMVDLARRGVSPTVVDDQRGRLTFADDLAMAIGHLIDTRAAYGTYNVTNSGPPKTWFDIADNIFSFLQSSGTVTAVSTRDYAAGKDLAPRPAHSTLDLTKAAAAGIELPEADSRLQEYLAALVRET